jgi:hypothetical protein
MTKRHFKALAELVAGWRERHGLGPAEELGHALAELCAQDNPRFDWARFYRACDLSEMAEIHERARHGGLLASEQASLVRGVRKGT